jgi:hypothetical protein
VRARCPAVREDGRSESSFYPTESSGVVRQSDTGGKLYGLRALGILEIVLKQ